MKEFHLHFDEFSDSRYRRADMLHNLCEVEFAIQNGWEIHTTQVITCTTDLFTRGYRVFIHDPRGTVHEIFLETCGLGNREIRMGHNLPNLILAGEFCDLHDNQYKEKKL